MVIYFSATGNTEFIAKQLSERLSDDSLNLINRIKERDYSPIESSSPFVICSPVYVCEMPRFFAEYLKKVKLTGNNKVYFVFTSGGYAGIAGYLAEKIIKKKGMTLCPFNNIDIVDGHPVWGNSCEHCMACISNCPFEAIEYGDISLDQKRYRLGKYVGKDGLFR